LVDRSIPERDSRPRDLDFGIVKKPYVWRSNARNLATSQSVGQFEIDPVDSLDSGKWISNINSLAVWPCVGKSKRTSAVFPTLWLTTSMVRKFSLVRIDEDAEYIRGCSIQVHTVSSQSLVPGIDGPVPLLIRMVSQHWRTDARPRLE
jgi:hypothetical protein